MAYATTSELADYLGYDSENDLPDEWDWERLLERASEFVDFISNKPDGIDTTEDDKATAARKATSAQVEWWYENDDEFGIKGNISSLKVGSYSVSFSGADGSTKGLPIIAPRAKQYLHLAGLTYTGVEMK